VRLLNRITDKNGRELLKHGSLDFPCDAGQTINGGYPWHWHEELEMIYIIEGCVTVAVAEQRHLLNAGDGIAINANVPHALFPYGKSEYNENAIIFHPRLIYGSMDSVLWGDYVGRYLQCESLKGIPLYKQVDWQKEATERILKAWKLCREKPAMYEFAVREELTRLFMSIWEHYYEQAAWTTKSIQRKTDQVKDMMRFLETHMREEMSLKQLADYAHLSERECQREFQSYIGTTPIQYLNQIRLAKAADLLREGRVSITEVCYQSGFQSPSYFSKKFRLRYGITPRQYQSYRK
jgi:AraC-like DNA-binding protein